MVKVCTRVLQYKEDEASTEIQHEDIYNQLFIRGAFVASLKSFILEAMNLIGIEYREGPVSGLYTCTIPSLMYPGLITGVP